MGIYARRNGGHDWREAIDNAHMVLVKVARRRAKGRRGKGEKKMTFAEHKPWLCPVCSTPIWADWERGTFLCPECDRDLWEVETGQGEEKDEG